MNFLQLLNFFTSLDAELGNLIATHGNLIYVILFAIVFTEIGFLPLFFLPGDPLIFITGSFCKIGSLSLVSMMLTLSVAAFLGNLISYKIGSVIGKKLDASQYRWINKKALEKTQSFYMKHGKTTLFISPYIAVVRTFAPFLAGVANMSLGKYTLASCIGTTFWIVSLMLAGYFFSEIAFIRNHMASIVLMGLGIGIACILAGAALSKKQKTETP